MNDVAFVTLAAFADTFRTVLGVLLALAGLGAALYGVIDALNKAWKPGLTFLLVGVALLAIGLHLAGAISNALNNIVGTIVSLSGVIFVGLGIIALPGPTKQQGIAGLGGGLILILAGLWIMGGL